MAFWTGDAHLAVTFWNAQLLTALRTRKNSINSSRALFLRTLKYAKNFFQAKLELPIFSNSCLNVFGENAVICVDENQKGWNVQNSKLKKRCNYNEN